MSVEVHVPELGESIVDAVVGIWEKHEGDAVQQGDVLVELETDKVNLEVSAEQSGILQKILKQEGDVVTVGEAIGVIGEQAEVSTPVSSAPAASPAQNAQQTAPAAPVPVAAQQVPASTDGKRSPSPLARRIAEEHNVDLSQVPGSSQYGRVTKDDVIHYLEQQTQPAPAQPVPAASAVSQVQTAPAPSASRAAPAPTQTPTQAPAPAFPLTQLGTEARREERVRLSRRRQTIAQRLVETQHTAAMLTTFNEIDMSAVMEVRSRRKESFKERNGVSLGFMSFFTKAVIGVLKAFPRLNAEIQGNEMILKHYYDIGIAVGVEEGLVVPVVRDADRKSFAEIEREIAELAKKARENRLALAELQGGTFTITNGGVFGSLLSTPILNGPQVGILGMHKIEQRPMAVNGQVVIRPMMYVALSYDHRIVDGSEAVRFLVRVKELVEDPEALLLEG
ncbi:MAG TPA: 2-oxoglutarate dehydrogenase complex dihydrolipoyllysine-residue succinyltransferase [Ktedonobacteraceae bacterium]|nr:2-oxoglutarate dehydrogenase complex dihydrolipoyllysine-residue succinyltransferase [Ktedonobacteraceae bacterium]